MKIKAHCSEIRTAQEELRTNSFRAMGRCSGLVSTNRYRKGSELLEFSFVLLPLLAMITVVMDFGWSVFAKSTLQRAVRIGVTTGTTLTASQLAANACLTDTVKSTVQQNSLGFLAGTAGLNSIKVNYLQPPAPNSSGPTTDVSTQSDGDSSGNIMQVSVSNYSLTPLIVRIFGKHYAPDNSPLGITVYSAGLIEPSQNPPCIGTAP